MNTWSVLEDFFNCDSSKKKKKKKKEKKINKLMNE